MTAWLLVLALQESCESCHGDVLDDVGGSIHFKKGVDCKSCHGSDDIDSLKSAEGKSPHLFRPTFTGKPKDIVKFCARCHAAVAEHFASGKHAKNPKPMDCLACHSHHKTEEAEFSKLVKWCYACHKEQMGPSHEIQSIVAEVSERGDRMQKRFDSKSRLKGVPGIDLAPDQARLEEALHRGSTVKEAQHGVDRKVLAEARDRVRLLEEESARSLEEKETSLAHRPYYLAGFLILWVGTGILAARFLRRRYHS
jgi:hypothetical protein